jgi:hypothetical protein
MSGFSTAAALKAQGKTVGDLRKVGISPADIRAAGYTLHEMYQHLGIHRLNEAGFTLSDYLLAHIELREVASHFSLADILRTNRSIYSLAELAKKYHGSELRTVGGFTAAEFVSQVGTTAAELQTFGYSESEIAASGVSAPPSGPVVPGPWQPPHAASMQVGDTWKFRHETSPEIDVTYTRLPENEARRLHQQCMPLSVSGYSYNGSGKNCPRCGRKFVLVEHYASSDGMCAVERGAWICDDVQCGMHKSEKYEGYGSIFGE